MPNPANAASTFDDTVALMSRVTGDSKHSDSSSSTLDVLWVLYNLVMSVDPSNPEAETRDRFLLSKGHGPLAYYAVLCARGFFEPDWLDEFGTWKSPLGLHPDRRLIPGVEVSTGSLGHGLPMAVGIALALRAKHLVQPRVFVLCGDAELNEGSNWEAILLAAHLRLGLTLVVVDNHSSSVCMQPWTQRFEGFDWVVRHVSSTDHTALQNALTLQPSGRPMVVIADVAESES